jgi:hypothetical protein
VLRLFVAVPAHADNDLIALDQVLGSWQGDDTVQFVQLRMLADGQQELSDGGGTRGTTELVFDDASGSADTRRVFTFTHDLANGTQDSRILIATTSLTATANGLVPDFVLPPGMVAPRSGRVCYVVNPPQADGETTGVIDCVAYGAFTGDNGSFGPPTPITPDDRSLQRVATSGQNASDWAGQLQPTPQNNAAAGVQLPTLCGDGQVSQGEQCDGSALAGQTCGSLGFAHGTLACTQCHFDASGCSFCGNDVINSGEQCDGSDVAGRTCTALGFTGGSLTCSSQCRLSTVNCSPNFLVPGGGPRGPECLAEWLVTNPTSRPGPDGRAPVRQACKDGDAGCDSDPAAGRCGFTVALCFDHDDARLATNGQSCRRTPIESWTLLKPAPGTAADTLVTAAAALAPSSSAGGVVTFTPPLDTTERCTEPVTIAVPTRGRRPGVVALRARTAGAGGHPRDVDTLKLVCVP